MKQTLSALFLLLLYCQTPMTPLELDLHHHRQHASSLHKKIMASKYAQLQLTSYF